MQGDRGPLDLQHIRFDYMIFIPSESSGMIIIVLLEKIRFSQFAASFGLCSVLQSLRRSCWLSSCSGRRDEPGTS